MLEDTVFFKHLGEEFLKMPRPRTILSTGLPGEGQQAVLSLLHKGCGQPCPAPGKAHTSHNGLDPRVIFRVPQGKHGEAPWRHEHILGGCSGAAADIRSHGVSSEPLCNSLAP